MPILELLLEFIISNNKKGESSLNNEFKKASTLKSYRTNVSATRYLKGTSLGQYRCKVFANIEQCWTDVEPTHWLSIGPLCLFIHSTNSWTMKGPTMLT